MNSQRGSLFAAMSVSSHQRYILPVLLAVCMMAFPAAAEDTADGKVESGAPVTLIEGLVVDVGGKPVPGATVLAVSSEAKPVRKPRGLFSFESSSRRAATVAEAIAGEDGRFQIEVEGSAPFILRAQADGFAASRLTVDDPAETVTMNLSTGWTVRGAVFDQDTGKPVPGAEVHARANHSDGLADEQHRENFLRKMACDEKGRFVFVNLESNYYRILAVADGYSEDLVSNLEVGLQGKEPDAVYLYLLPGVTVASTVVAGDGSPIDGAWVRVRPEQTIPGGMQRWMRSGGFGGKSDEEGKFVIPGIPVTSSYVLEVGHEDYAPATVVGLRVRQGARSRSQEIVLTPGTTLTARLSAGGKPFKGKVGVSLFYSVPGSNFTPRIGRGGDDVVVEEGKLTVRRLPPGRAGLTITPRGFSDIKMDGLKLAADEPFDLGEINLEAGLSISGRVLNDDGRPVAGAGLQIMSLETGTLTRATTESEDDGTFRFGGVQELAFTVSAEADGYGRASLKEIKPDGDPVELVLHKAGSIRGRVTAGDPAKPLAGFTLESKGNDADDLPMQLKMVGLDKSRMSFFEPLGEFVVGGLGEGTYSIKVEAAGFTPSRLEKIEVAVGEASDVGTIHLDKGATLFGTVREKGSGRPVGGATVKIEQPGIFNMQAFTEMGLSSLMTGPDGRFTIAGLVPGKHTVRVDHERFSTARAEFEIASGVPPSELSVELLSGGAIEGTLRDKEGNLVANGMIMAMQGFVPDPKTMGSADENGHFRIDNLSPGSYRIMAMADPAGGRQDPSAMMGSLQMQTVDVTDGKTSVVNIPPDSGSIIVSGTLRKGATRLEARMFWIRLAADGATPEDFTMAASDESGAFQVHLSGPGEYRVTIQLSGEKQDMMTPGMSLAVEIPDEEQVTRDLVIPEIVIGGTVLDAATGERLEGVAVTALEYQEDRPVREHVLGTSTRTDEDGAYTLEGLGENTYTLIFSREGYGAQALDPMELDEDETDEGLNIALEPVENVLVRVSDIDENPIEGAFVSSQEFPVMVIAGTTGQTDMNGEIVLSGLTEGAHELGVMATGYAPVVFRDAIVPTENGEPIMIEVSAGGSLTLQIVDSEDRPVSDASIRVREENGADLTSMLMAGAIFEGRGLLSDGSGSITIPNLAYGRYEIEIQWQEIVVEDKVKVVAGKENVREISFR